MKRIFAAVVMLALALPALAQSGLNQFEEPRTLILAGPATIAATTTNAAVDTHGFVGIAKVDIYAQTNLSAEMGAITAVLQVSADQTNWVNTLNYALGTRTSVIYTNNYYGSGITATNAYNLPGVLTTATAASGFSGQYIQPARFTNSGAITLTPGTLATIGYNIQDAPRYVRVYFTTASTNAVVGAILTARKQQFP